MRRRRIYKLRISVAVRFASFLPLCPPFLGAQKIRGDLRSPRQHNVRAFAVPHDPLHQGLHSGAFLRKPHCFHTFRERREPPALCFKLPCAEHILRGKALQLSDAFSQFPVQFMQRPDSF